MRNLSYENKFCMQFHFHANRNHFHKNGFTLRLALKERGNSEITYGTWLLAQAGEILTELRKSQDESRKIRIKRLKESNVCVAGALFDS